MTFRSGGSLYSTVEAPLGHFVGLLSRSQDETIYNQGGKSIYWRPTLLHTVVTSDVYLLTIGLFSSWPIVFQIKPSTNKFARGKLVAHSNCGSSLVKKCVGLAEAAFFFCCAFMSFKFWGRGPLCGCVGPPLRTLIQSERVYMYSKTVVLYPMHTTEPFFSGVMWIYWLVSTAAASKQSTCGYR